MEDNIFADEVILRLNDLIKDPDVRKDICALIETSIPCSQSTKDHPTIQVRDGSNLSFLGVLNGLAGIDPNLVGNRSDWGYIVAYFDDDMNLVSFKRVVNG